MPDIDPKTGFIIRESGGPVKPYTAPEPKPEPASHPSAFTDENLRNHAFYQANKAEILAAMARGELPGQANFTADSNDD